MELKMFICFLLLAFISLECISAQWSWRDHPESFPITTGVTLMMSGSTPKLFGVSNSLKEGVWNGNKWVWVDHYAPWGLWSGEKLASKPCIIKDGSIFVITNKGRLVERYWDGSKWVWDHHTNPAGVPLRYQSGCTATDGVKSRVYVVGNDFKVYEKYWSWPIPNSWQWRTIGSPAGILLSTTPLTSCNLETCPNNIYMVSADGILYRLHISDANLGIITWSNLGCPTDKRVSSVTVSDHGYVFVSTTDSNVCIFNSANNFNCYGKPGSYNQPPNSIQLSKPMFVSSCPKLPGFAVYIFMHAYDPATNTVSKVWSLKATSWTTGSFTYHGKFVKYPSQGAPCCSNDGPPELIAMDGCPKSFTADTGLLHERYVQ